MKLLNVIDVAGHLSQLDSRIPGTFEWVVNTAPYKAWNSRQETRLICVSGSSGLGKTILSSYISDRLSSNDSAGTMMFRFFFDATRSEQKKGCSFLRSLIYQLITNSRKHIKFVRRRYDLQGPGLFNRFNALWDLFVDLVRSEPVQRINVVIDGVDECETESQRTMIECIAGLVTSRTAPFVKFFLTCRSHAPALYVLEDNLRNSTKYVSLNLDKEQSLIAQDVNLVVSWRLEQMTRRGIIDNDSRKRLEESLLSRAERSFLWVSIVLSSLEGGDQLFLSSSDLLTFIKKLPLELKATYRGFLESIPFGARSLAGSVLRSVAVSARPLHIKELQILRAIRPDHKYVSDLETQMIKFGEFSVQRLLGPLVRVSGSEVSLTHTSLKDFLIELGQDKEDPIAADFGVDLGRDVVDLAQSCMSYLASEDFQDDLFADQIVSEVESPTMTAASPHPTVSTSESDDLDLIPAFFFEECLPGTQSCRSIAERYAFFDYAAIHWSTHLSQAKESATSDLHDLAILLCQPSTHRFNNWYRYLRTWNISETGDSHQPYPEEASLQSLAVASFFDLSSTVRHCMSKSSCTEPELGNAIYWSARKGHGVCLKSLLSADGVKPEMVYATRVSPLAAAAENGHLECVNMLLQSKSFNGRERGKESLTPLALACRGGHADVVDALLQDAQVAAYATILDNDHWTPLFWAVEANSPPIVSNLLKVEGVDSNAVDRKGRSPIAWAAIGGHEKAAMVLIQSPRIDLNLQDLNGQTPLIHAIKSKQIAIVRSLLRSRHVDSGIKDNDGRNAISWAAGQANYSILNALLRYERETGRMNADVEDVDGWAPLAWAIEKPGYPLNVSFLLHAGSADANHKDRHGRSVLSFVAGYGLVEITKTLACTPGIELNSRSHAGRTPFSYAAGNGCIEVATVLLDAGFVEVNQQDVTGRTPLSWASSGGHVDMVQFLVDLQEVEPDLPDNSNRTPLDIAIKNGHRDVGLRLSSAAAPLFEC